MEALVLIIVIAVVLYLGLHRPVQDAADMAVSATSLLKDKQQLSANKFYLSNKVSKRDAIKAELNRRTFTSYADMDDEELEAALRVLEAPAAAN